MYATETISDYLLQCDDIETLKRQILPLLETQRSRWKEKIAEILRENHLSCRDLAKLCGVSDIGCRRRKNEDTFLLQTRISQPADRSALSAEGRNGTCFLAGVFDGIGSGGNGDRASQTAAGVFRRLRPEASQEDMDVRIRRGFQEANNHIVGLREKMTVAGTTGTVLAICRGACKIYHMGDSRAYLHRDGRMFQLTQDQTLAQMRMDLGLYDRDDPRAGPESHMLTDYIGADTSRSRVSPAESQWIPLQSGDRLLLCSDGLHGMCPPEQIREILSRPEGPESAAPALVTAAKARGGHDNITCVVIGIP